MGTLYYLFYSDGRDGRFFYLDGKIKSRQEEVSLQRERRDGPQHLLLLSFFVFSHFVLEKGRDEVGPTNPKLHYAYLAISGLVFFSFIKLMRERR